MVSLTMEIPQLLFDVGGLCPWCAGRASSTGAVVEKTVVLPQLHLLRNSLRAAGGSVPVVCNNRYFGSRSEQNCGFSAVAVLQHGRRHLLRCLPFMQDVQISLSLLGYAFLNALIHLPVFSDPVP